LQQEGIAMDDIAFLAVSTFAEKGAALWHYYGMLLCFNRELQKWNASGVSRNLTAEEAEQLNALDAVRDAVRGQIMTGGSIGDIPKYEAGSETERFDSEADVVARVLEIMPPETRLLLAGGWEGQVVSGTRQPCKVYWAADKEEAEILTNIYERFEACASEDSYDLSCQWVDAVRKYHSV
jgi:hypothetical protein